MKQNMNKQKGKLVIGDKVLLSNTWGYKEPVIAEISSITIGKQEISQVPYHRKDRCVFYFLDNSISAHGRQVTAVPSDSQAKSLAGAQYY